MRATCGQVKTFMLLLLLGCLMCAASCGTDPDPAVASGRAGEAQRVLEHETTETVAEAGPRGEWWARVGGTLVLAVLHRGKGHLVLRRRGTDHLLAIEEAFPYSPKLRELAEICYRVHNHWESTWYCRLPQMADTDYGKPLDPGDSGEFDLIVVERNEGTVEIETPFSLYRSGRYDPSQEMSTEETRALKEMREVLRRRRGDRG